MTQCPPAMLTEKSWIQLKFTIASDSQIRPVLRVSLTIAVFHFILVLFGGILFVVLGTDGNYGGPRSAALSILAVESSDWVSRWYRWDSLWLVELTRFGYEVLQNPDGTLAQSNVAFLPGIPALANVAESIGFNPWTSILFINLVADFLLCLGLGTLALELTGSAKTANWSLVCYAAWPWHYFIVAPYQEAVGLACLVWGLYLGMKQRFLYGFILTFAAAFFRLTAIGLVAGIIAGAFFMMVTTKERKQWGSLIFAASGTLIGWFTLLAYFQTAFGDAQIGIKVQTAWGRSLPHLMGPFESLASPLIHKLTGSAWLDWCTSIFTCLCLPVVWRKLGPVWACGFAVLMAQSLSTGLVISYGRYMLTAFPLFIMFGIMAENHRRSAKVACFCSFILQFMILWRYANGLFGG